MTLGLVIAISTIVNCEVAEIEINCESFGVFGNKSCVLGETEINSANTIIAESDETVEAMWMHENKKAFYLPNKISEKFPNIVLYQADRCSIKEISKDNFHGLTKLRELDLSENQIESLTDGTFDGLLNLHFLRLSITLKVLLSPPVLQIYIFRRKQQNKEAASSVFRFTSVTRISRPQVQFVHRRRLHWPRENRKRKKLSQDLQTSESFVSTTC